MTEDVQIIMNTIEKLADKLGIAVEQVAQIFIHAQVVIGMVNVITAVVVIITTIVVGYMVGKATYKDHHDSKDAIGEAVTSGFFVGVIWLLIFSAILSVVLPSIYMIVAPEYMGLKDMITTLRP